MRSTLAILPGGTKDVDLVVANKITNDVDILLNSGGGAFGAPIAPGTTPSTVGTTGIVTGFGTPIQVAAADFNGDNNFDVAVLYSGGTTEVFYGTGKGTVFTASTPDPFFPGLPSPSLVPTPAGATHIAVGDFNGDKSPDIASVDASGDLYIATGAGNGVFSPASADASITNVGTNPIIAAFDINGDNQTGYNGRQLRGHEQRHLPVRIKGGAGVTPFSFNVNITDPSFSLNDLTVAINLIESNLSNVEIELVPPTSVQNYLASLPGYTLNGQHYSSPNPTVILIDPKQQNPTLPTLSGSNLGVVNYTPPSDDCTANTSTQPAPRCSTPTRASATTMWGERSSTQPHCDQF